MFILDEKKVSKNDNISVRLQSYTMPDSWTLETSLLDKIHQVLLAITTLNNIILRLLLADLLRKTGPSKNKSAEERMQLLVVYNAYLSS